MHTDQNATNFIKVAFSYAGNPTVISNYPISDIGKHYVPWDCEKVEELANGVKVSEHEWENKKEKFKKFKRIYLKNVYNEITLFAVRSSSEKPILIIDGVHRAVGVYKAYLEEQSIQYRTNIILVLFESTDIEKIPDYKKITNGCE